MEKLITIELLGQPFTFKAEEEASRAEEIADILEKEVARVEKQINNGELHVTKQAILALAALNIAGEYFKIKNNYSDLLMSVSKRTVNLIHQLDEI